MVLVSLGTAALIIGALLVPITLDSLPATIGGFVCLVSVSYTNHLSHETRGNIV